METTTPTTWSSPRDEFPTSVRALMGLWGGFSAATQCTDSGLEKRLELDFAGPVSPSTWDVPELTALLQQTVQQTLQGYTLADDLLALTFDESMMVMSANKLVLNSVSTVMLHRVLLPLLRLLKARGVGVEWACFFRKNTTSPWVEDSAMRDVMAQEYADLKAAFPAGQSLLVGPVDGDHFFHFVYDNVDRHVARPEADAQLNVILFDVQARARESGTGCDKPASQQVLRPLGGGEYEMLRRHTDVPHVSFETNAAAATVTPTRIVALLDEFRPSHFTLVALQDRDIDAQQLRRALGTFAGYHIQCSTVNHFGEGYAYHHMVFTHDTH